MSMGTAIPELRTVNETPEVTLAEFVADLVSKRSCFCCGSSADLLLGSSGRVLLRCPSCAAEVGTGDRECVGEGEPVLRAA